MFLVQDDVSIVNHWQINGNHYAQTRYDCSEDSVHQLFACNSDIWVREPYSLTWRAFLLLFVEMVARVVCRAWFLYSCDPRPRESTMGFDLEIQKHVNI
jgi:hypothetical protein